MFDKDVVLCSASCYKKKFYINPQFKDLPELIKQELQIDCVLFTEEVGGIILMIYDRAGNLNIRTVAEDGDLLYDEIGAGLKIRQMISEKQELFEQLERYYQVFFGEQQEE